MREKEKLFYCYDSMFRKPFSHKTDEVSFHFIDTGLRLPISEYASWEVQFNQSMESYYNDYPCKEVGEYMSVLHNQTES